MSSTQFKEAFKKELTQINVGRAYLISLVGFFFGIALLFIDVLRYRAGYFSDNEWYIIVPCLHFLLVLMIVPAIVFKTNKKRIETHTFESANQWTNSCILLTFVSLVPMSLLGIVDRGSIMPFGAFIILVNLYFVLPMRNRLYINLLAFVFLFIGILYLDINYIIQSIYLLEALGFIVPTVLIANNQYRLMKDSFDNRALLEVKNESMQEKNDDLMMQALQAQMNPHFIFNTLNSIQHFLVANDQKSSLTYLSRFARLMRRIFQYSKERWIKLDEEIEFLNLYLQLEELRFENKIAIDFQVDRQLKEMSHDYVVPPLLIQPLIENAFKHGLMHVENGGRLTIQFKQVDACMKCIIEDNGVGREKAKAYDVSREEKHRSSALEIIQQRLKMFNSIGSMDANGEELNYLKLTDLTDADGKSSGTRIDLKICLETQRLLYERSFQNVQSLYSTEVD